MRSKEFLVVALTLFVACSNLIERKVETPTNPPAKNARAAENDAVGLPPPPPPPPPGSVAPHSQPVALMGGVAGGVMGGVAGGVPAQEAMMLKMRANVEFNTEEYGRISENAFLRAAENPLSTFSVDVDRASYSNVRRFLLDQRQLPPRDAVRIEEMVNYFRYAYAEPKGSDPFSIHTELADCPWSQSHYLLKVGLQARRIATEKLPPSNLVFLLDVSGSMESPDKLPLLKSALPLLVDQLRERDRVSIVVYAGNAGVVLPSTAGSDHGAILEAIGRLEAGGSTAGGEGIRLAYELAKKNFIRGGNNRVILATDGDFNVGTTSDGELEKLIEEKRRDGIFLTVLGFGTGNIKDSKMELLADKGNGNYAYIDSLMEARKVLVSEIGGTLFTVAKDVKLQLEFNPAHVAGYRLLGYENRLLRSEDFNDDTKDAGEVGSGHSVTALYEIVPAGVEVPGASVDPLKYQTAPKTVSSAELLTVKVRYKEPDDESSRLMSMAVVDSRRRMDQASEDLRFAAAVAEFGMLLRGSEHRGEATYEQVARLASTARSDDRDGYRSEFLQLVDAARAMTR